MPAVRVVSISVYLEFADIKSLEALDRNKQRCYHAFDIIETSVHVTVSLKGSKTIFLLSWKGKEFYVPPGIEFLLCFI